MMEKRFKEFEKKGLWYSRNLELDNDKSIEKNVCLLITREFAIEFKIIPIYSDIDDNENLIITCITSRYSNLQKINMFEKALNAQIKLIFCSEENLINGLVKFYEVSIEQIKLSRVKNSQKSEDVNESEEEINISDANDPEGVQTKFKQMYRNIIDTAVLQHASDIHLLPMQNHLQVIFRINGERIDFTENFNIDSRIQSRIINIVKKSCRPTMNDSNIIKDDGRITYHYKEGDSIRDIDCRVNAVPVDNGQKLAIRILDTKATIPELNTSLGYHHDEIELIMKAVLKPQGIVIVAGPTGSGKSTSLAAMDAVFSPVKYHKIHICDPVEYRDERITQINIRENGSDDDITYESILPHLVRQDPDNLLIGEIRDKKSALAAMNFAATGHRILTTIHAANILSIFERFEFIGLSKYAILGQTNALIAQRLIPLICEECKEVYIPKKEYINQFDINEISKICNFYHGKGCSKCNHSGISKRVVISEILVLNNAIKDMLKHDLDIVETMDNLKKMGNFETIVEKSYEYLKDGQVSLDSLIDIIPR